MAILKLTTFLSSLSVATFASAVNLPMISITVIFLFNNAQPWPRSFFLDSYTIGHAEGKTSAEGGKILPRQNAAARHPTSLGGDFSDYSCLVFPGAGQYLRCPFEGGRSPDRLLPAMTGAKMRWEIKKRYGDHVYK